MYCVLTWQDPKFRSFNPVQFIKDYFSKCNIILSAAKQSLYRDGADFQEIRVRFPATEGFFLPIIV
jgi:hypothetical protein